MFWVLYIGGGITISQPRNFRKRTLWGTGLEVIKWILTCWIWDNTEYAGKMAYWAFGSWVCRLGLEIKTWKYHIVNGRYYGNRWDCLERDCSIGFLAVKNELKEKPVFKYGWLKKSQVKEGQRRRWGKIRDTFMEVARRALVSNSVQ